MVSLLAACVTAFLISFIILPLIIKYSLAKNLVDTPGRRKIHKKVTPSLGGIAIFIGFVVSALIWVDLESWTSIRYIFASLFIVFLLGVRDDLVPFKARTKLYGQIVAVVILLFSGIKISSLGGLLGVFEVPSAVGYLLTAFAVVILTNSFNLIDGLDGLAGSVGLVALTAFGAWFFLAGDLVFSILSFSMAGGVLAFLVYNWEPSEIFMGDTGAMVIGMLLAVMAVNMMNVNESLSPNHLVKVSAPIATAACFVIVPVSDTIRIIILRMIQGRSPFAPDKSHIHHAIMRLGMTHGQTAIILASVNLLFIVCALLAHNLTDNALLAGVTMAAFTLSFVLDRLIMRKLNNKPATK